MSYLIQHAIALAIQEYGEDWLISPPLFEEMPEVTGTWYVVLTLPRHEAIAAAGLIGRRFGAYCPQEIYRQKSNQYGKGRKVLAKPMLPGYIFASFDVNGDRWKRRISSIAGVRRVLMVDEKPVPIAEECMIRIREKEAEINSGKPKLPDMPIVVGSTVQVVDRLSFMGLPLLVMDTDAKRQKVAVDVELLGVKSRVWLRVNQVKVV